MRVKFGEILCCFKISRVGKVIQFPDIECDDIQLSSVVSIAIMVGIVYIGSHSLEIIRKDLSRIGYIAILSIREMIHDG